MKKNSIYSEQSTIKLTNVNYFSNSTAFHNNIRKYNKREKHYINSRNTYTQNDSSTPQQNIISTTM